MLFLTTYAIGVSQTIKIYYDVDVEKGAYIYSDSDNTQFMVAISNSFYDLESEHNVMTTDKGYTCPLYHYDLETGALRLFRVQKTAMEHGAKD